MRKAKLSGFLVITVCAVALGYHLAGKRSADPAFRPLAHPEGFRELVIETRSTRPAPTSAPNLEARSPGGFPAQERGGIDVCRALFHDAASPATGDDAAKVILVEFFDYQCPYCKTLAAMIRELRQEHGFRVIYKEWPILGADSALAARAALAADRQGGYREFHYRLMQSGFVPTIGYIDALAAELGMDRSQLHADMNSDEVAQEIGRTSALAASLGLVGTPSLVVGRTIVHGALAKAQLESLLASEAASQQDIPC